MLTSFQVDNFKSLVNVSIEPVGLNVLVGRNNTGKSNLCRAMWFLSRTAGNSLEESAKGCGLELSTLANVYLDKPTMDFRVECRLPWEGETLDFEYVLRLNVPRYAREGLPERGLSVCYERLRITDGRFEGTPLMENDAGKVKLLHEEGFLDRESDDDNYVHTKAPTDHTMLFRLYDLETNQRSNLFKRYLGSWQYFDLNPLALRESAARPLNLVLHPDGSNLSSVLYNLKSSHEREYRAIVEEVKRVEPKLDIIAFHSPDAERVFMFFEDKERNKFATWSISDGTLRYLALCTLITVNRRAAEDGAWSQVVMVEEPENGLYVGVLKGLLEGLAPSGSDGQYLFSSHSPYFIDLFDKHLDGVWVASTQNTHTSIERPPRDKLRDRLRDFPLGEMHYRELLT